MKNFHLLTFINGLSTLRWKFHQFKIAMIFSRKPIIKWLILLIRKYLRNYKHSLLYQPLTPFLENVISKFANIVKSMKQ